jgi:hypothetical protein
MVMDEAGPCGRETMDSDMRRSSQAVDGIQTGVTSIDSDSGISRDGRQMQYKAAVASTSWASRAFSRRALQRLISLRTSVQDCKRSH